MKTTLPLLLLISSLSLKAQVGDLFPPMEAESLTSDIVNLPDDLKGKYTLIGLAFSKKAEDNLKTWFSPVWNQFVREHGKADIFATDYDINLFFIPMFTGHKTVAYKKVMVKVQKTTDPNLHPHILFYKGTMKVYKKALGFKGKDVPYFYMMDESGKIVWQTSGVYSDSKMQEVIDSLDKALGEWD
ncbi:MAG: hypothetical protein GY816_04510 [Cytophagales bacterium]|nr:hypothetical protein [Cytophagales bacterium]